MVDELAVRRIRRQVAAAEELLMIAQHRAATAWAAAEATIDHNLRPLMFLAARRRRRKVQDERRHLAEVRGLLAEAMGEAQGVGPEGGQ